MKTRPKGQTLNATVWRSKRKRQLKGSGQSGAPNPTAQNAHDMRQMLRSSSRYSFDILNLLAFQCFLFTTVASAVAATNVAANRMRKLNKFEHKMPHHIRIFSERAMKRDR